jgi:hypothetical protein
VLQSAGIPAEFDYHPFVEKFGWPMGSLRPITILVPPAFADEAAALLAAEPEAEWIADAERELERYPAFPRGIARVAVPYLFVADPPFTWPFALFALGRWFLALKADEPGADA